VASRGARSRGREDLGDSFDPAAGVGRTPGGPPDGRESPRPIAWPEHDRRSRTCCSTWRAGVSIALIGRRAGVPWPATAMPSSTRQRRGGSTGCPSHGLTRPGLATGQERTAPPQRGKPRVPGPQDGSTGPVPGTAGGRPIRRPALAGATIGLSVLPDATWAQHRALSRSAIRPAARRAPIRRTPSRPALTRPVLTRPGLTRPALSGLTPRIAAGLR
jgi:hypothetical protein